jgi:hypothetical protein
VDDRGLEQAGANSTRRRHRSEGSARRYTFLTVIAAHAANATLYAGKLPSTS